MTWIRRMERLALAGIFACLFTRLLSPGTTQRELFKLSPVLLRGAFAIPDAIELATTDVAEYIDAFTIGRGVTVISAA